MATGTNMNSTMTSGREEVENNLSKNIGELKVKYSQRFTNGVIGNLGSSCHSYSEDFVKY